MGVGLAPLLIGMLNDYFDIRFGAQSLRYSLTFMLSGAALGAVCAGLTNIWIRADYSKSHDVDAIKA